MFLKSHIRHLFIYIAVVAIAMAGLCAHAALPEDTSEVLQFTSSEHVLCFQKDGVYIAAGNHMLKESFAGAKMTAPETDHVFSKNGQAQSLETVTYPNLWEGITLTYDSPKGSILRSTYHIKPWANPDQIVLRYNVPIHLDVKGNLVFEFDAGTLTASAPIAWQKKDGKHALVDVAFHLDSNLESIHFTLGHYNPALPLFIDPTLTWNTFMGSAASDSGEAIALDSEGNIYITGIGGSAWGSPVNGYTGSTDAVVAKLNNKGELQWHTFLGSSSTERGYAIAVDESGNIYVTGESYGDWGNPLHPFTGGVEAFIAKLNSNTGETQWTTFMGGSLNDAGFGIALDQSGNIYISGHSMAGWGNPVNGHTTGTANDDAFVAKLNSSGGTEWHTFFGSNDGEVGMAIAVGGAGYIYVTGYSEDTWGSPVNPYTDGFEAFVAKLNNSGETLWHTFMGSSDDDFGYAIALDNSGNVYVAGSSETSWGNPVYGHTGEKDGFIAKLNKSNGILQWNTFMGSTVDDEANDIAIDENGGLYVCGISSGTWGNPINDYTGSGEAFAAKLNSNGILKWNTFMGSETYDSSKALTLDPFGNIYLTGKSYLSWGSPINDHYGIYNYDIFVAKILKGPLNPGIPLLLLGS